MSVGTARVDESREEWLADLYRAHAAAVRGYCQRFLRSPEDAADATQEVFVRAIGGLHAPPHSPQARRWLITVAQNYCLDQFRRRRRMQTALTVLAADGESQQQSESDIMNRQLLDAVLQQLGPRERNALWQSAILHRSVGEIAASLGISYMAAAQVLHRARKHATAVASKLAVILGLAGANALRRRPRGLGLAQTLAAIAIAPVVIAIATPSSSGHAAGLSPRVATAARATHPTPRPPTAGGLSITTATTASSPDLNQPRLRLVRRSVGTVHSLLGTVTATIQQLTKGTMPPLPALPSPPALPVTAPTALPTPPPAPAIAP